MEWVEFYITGDEEETFRCSGVSSLGSGLAGWKRQITDTSENVIKFLLPHCHGDPQKLQT